MDRFDWLNCQSWLLPASPTDAADAVDWFFGGFASFCTCSLPHQQDEALSENAAHLFFSVQSPSTSLDPAQLTLKLGIRQASRCFSRDIVFAFEDTGSYYFLDFKQVVSIFKWRREQGCKICKECSDVSAAGEMENNCACQLLPSYVTVRLKHVSLIIYTRSQSNSKIFGVMDVLCKAFEEERTFDFQGTEKEVSTPSVSECPGGLNTVLGSSKKAVQQFLTRLDCMSECAVGAVDVCSADVPHMVRTLHALMEHAAEYRECNVQAKSLKCQLQSCLKALEDEKETHFSSIWATTQQEAKAGAIATLQFILEQKKKLEEAILWMELMNANCVY